MNDDLPRASGKSLYEAADGSFSYEQEIRGSIVYGTPRGRQRGEHARAVLVVLEAVRARLPRFKWLIDFSELDSADAESRKIMIDFTRGETSPVSRLAAVGANPIMRAILNLSLRISSAPVRLFANREDALAWIERDDP